MLDFSHRANQALVKNCTLYFFLEFMSMYDLGGTYRACRPQETLAKLEPLLWHTFGITRVANITQLDNIDLPTYVAIRPLSKLITTSQGKGVTHELAKISAIMESIEGWHAERLPEADLRGTYQELHEKYPLVNVHQIQRNDSFNMTFSNQRVEDVCFAWLKGTELNTGEVIYFPKCLIDLDTEVTYRKPNYNYFFSCSSNGLASGNTYEEAVCHGLYELIERDSWALAEHRTKRKIDPASITSPHLMQIIERLNPNEVQLEMTDITSEIGVPAYTASVIDLTGIHGLGNFSGAGAHLSSVVALSRAITEAIQARLTFAAGTRDDCYPSVYHSLRNSWIQAQLAKQEPTSPSVDLHAFVDTAVPVDFTASIELLLALLKQRGYEQVIIYNHTKPEVGIPVIHAIVPGLLYDNTKHMNHAYYPECI
jgi:YcaO-like protein with predicted kinase domain